MITPSLTAALSHKAGLPYPAAVRLANGQYEVVAKLQTMTESQHKGFVMAYEWHLAFNRTGDDNTFHPIQFEIHGIKSAGKGPALANELRQLGLLQCHNGRYWLSPAGFNLAKLLNIDNVEC